MNPQTLVIKGTLTCSLLGVMASMYASDVDEDHSNSFGIQVSIGTCPGIKKDVTTNSTTSSGAADPSNNGTSDDSARYGIDGEVGGIWNHNFESGWGLEVAPALFVRSVSGTSPISGTSSTGTDTMTAYGVRVAAGPTYQIDQFRFEITPFVEGGLASVKGTATISGTNYSLTTKTGSYVGYGVTAGGAYLINRQIALGVRIGYQAFSASTKINAQTVSGLPVDNEDDKWTGGGLIANASFIWSF